MRWTVVRSVGLAIAAVVAVGAMFQLPASPFTRHGLPERGVVPASVQSTAPLHPLTPAAPLRPLQPLTPAVPLEPPAPEAPQSAPRSAAPAEAISYPVAGTRSYGVLPGDPAVIGRAGTLLRFQVAVEGGIAGIDRAGFARFVRVTYGGAQGWASRGAWRFQQVGPGTNSDFTVMLVTPATRDLICGGAPDRYTSCRIGNQVVLNVARWVHGVRGYRASLTTYRQYMINHETGHRLGRGHELCRGPGRPAPVMQQQSLGLHGCTAYAWPYLNGLAYDGRPGQYDDPIPHS
ncbi:DUF3152 domain-containing protein [Kribbella shirazensis]|uniref:DUF3152 domain-containing protein n=1 Tax=Kribbella shirazensis TaxID=1105143 RepID=A0A7X5V6M7_9ACTN|nr:DUF3152 domain-containing protein [Kribbella shirazensis]NIK55616.1 hypothetical protein [Kribbella shirazensis]